MGDVRYEVSFCKDQLRGDIKDRLEYFLEDKSIQERDRIAGDVMDKIFELGNYAVYYGLVEYAVKLAINNARSDE